LFVLAVVFGFFLFKRSWMPAKDKGFCIVIICMKTHCTAIVDYGRVLASPFLFPCLHTKV